MKPIYPFNQIIEMIRTSSWQEVNIIADVFYDEQEKYSPYHREIIAYAISMQRRVMTSIMDSIKK
jgi:hypothetical protein